jgi:hypothetical protein
MSWMGMLKDLKEYYAMDASSRRPLFSWLDRAK